MKEKITPFNLGENPKIDVSGIKNPMNTNSGGISINIGGLNVNTIVTTSKEGSVNEVFNKVKSDTTLS